MPFSKTVKEITDTIAKGNLDDALEMIKMIESGTDDQEIVMNAIYYKSKIFLINCHYDEAHKLAKQSVEMAKQLDRQHFIAKSLALQGFAAAHMGQLEDALFILNEAEYFLGKYAEGTEDIDRNLINTAGNINNVKAITYWKMGELDEALHWHLKALEYREKLPKKLEVAITDSNIATVYRDMGNGEKAIEYYEKAYSIKKDLGNKRAISRVLFSIIQTALVFDFPHKVEEYSPHLDNIKYDENPFIQLNYKITKALILKSNKRLRQKMESEKIFSEIVAGETVNPHLTLLAMKHLWEIYLDEYKLFGEDEVLQQINSLTVNMKTIAASIGVTSHYVEALILQSKLAELDGSYNEASKLLDEAEAITRKKKLRKIERDVNKEKLNLRQSFSRWKGIIDSSTTIAEKMEMIQIKEYIIHAQKVAGVGFDE